VRRLGKHPLSFVPRRLSLASAPPTAVLFRRPGNAEKSDVAGLAVAFVLHASHLIIQYRALTPRKRPTPVNEYSNNRQPRVWETHASEPQLYR
jgi:hypothetical protein